LYHCWEEEDPHGLDIEIIREMRTSSLNTFFVEDSTIPFRAVDATTLIDQAFLEWGPGDFWYPVQSSAIRRSCWKGKVHIERSSADAILNTQAETVLLETSLALKPSFLPQAEFEDALNAIYSNHFKVLPVFQQIAENFACPGPYVGVHIRRGDHLRHFHAADISAKNWEKIIRRHVDSAEAVYICSDDAPFANAVTGRLQDYRIVRPDETFSHVHKLQAFSEFVCLSKATRIYGTIGSSFSREAARFGGLPFVFCSVRQPDTLLKLLLHCLRMGTQQITCTELSEKP